MESQNFEFEKLNEDFFEKMPDYISMMTKVWGPPTWFFLHSMAMAYPKYIDENDPYDVKIRDSMYVFLSNLGYVLPCGICGSSYLKYINTQELSISKYLNSRADLVHFIYLIHEKVNDKLGVPKCDRPSFKQVVEYYNKFRAHSACGNTTQEERVKSLMAGCDETDIEQGKFKSYKCNVDVINNNSNKHTTINNQIKEKFSNDKKLFSNSVNNGINIFLLILSILSIICLVCVLKYR